MAMNMTLKMDPIKGESKIEKDAFDVLAWSWGMSNNGSTHIGGGSGSGKVSVQDISLTKWLDKATPDLMKACCNGKHFNKATLTVRKAGGDKPLDYLKIDMENIIITGVSSGGSGGEDMLTENVVLNFGKVKVKYSLQSKTGGSEGDPEMSWNITENKSS